MRKGNEDGADRLRHLYEMYASDVLAYAVRRTTAREDANDVLADTFVVCWRRLADVPDGDQTLPWLYAVAHRMMANQRRGNQRRRQLVYILEGLQASVGVAATGAESSLLDEALDELRPDDRELLRLNAWEGLEAADLAVVLSCSPNAAAIRLHRARRNLQQKFTDMKASGTRRTYVNDD